MDEEVQEVVDKDVDKLVNQIDMDKEILSVLPKNTKKNLNIYKEKAAEIKAGYETYLDDLISEMKRRIVKITSPVPNPEIDRLEEEIKQKENAKKITKDVPSFEKMGLDETLFVLKRFYKNNLELINDAILECIEKFENAGVNVGTEDFNYSIHAKEYMKVFFEERKKGEVNSNRIKETFEQIYWKCSDIIMHIEISFRSLYLKNEKTLDKFFEEQAKLIGSASSYDSLINKLSDLKNNDTALILQKFLVGELVPKDYEEMAIQKAYKKLTGKDTNDMTTTQLTEYNKNIFRLRNSLYEYKNFLKFKFIFDEIAEVFKSEEKYKNLYNEKLKKIKSIEGKLVKVNKKTERYGRHRGLLQKIFSKGTKKIEKINVDINSKMEELRDLYRELDDSKTKDIIKTELTERSTIYDALLLIRPFYSFLVDAIIKQQEDIPQEEIKQLIHEFRDFVEYPNITIINHVKISEPKDMALMVKDKYNLCNINMTKGDLDEENIENLNITVENICNYNYIKNSEVNLEDIKYVLQVNKMLEGI